jgi:uncharacterized repeat protein (TIGR03803 family)
MKRIIKLLPATLGCWLGFPLGVAHAQVVNVLHSFAGGSTDGKSPQGALLQSGTTVVGLTSGGGSAADGGSIFTIGLDGSGYSQLLALAAGSNPLGSVTQLGSAYYFLTSGSGAAGQGAISKIGGGGTGLTTLHSFTGSPGDGNLPQGSLAVSGSTFYGYTSDGGSAGRGTIFKQNVDGTGYQILHNFAGGASDGWSPIGGAPAVSGTFLYGTTILGGTANGGVVYRMGTDGTGFTVLHSFALSPTDGNTPEGSVIVNGSTVYGMTSNGGSTFNGTIFTMATDGSGFTLLHSFGGAPGDGRSPLGELLLSGSELYGTTDLGGSANLGTLFQIGIDGSGYNVMHSFLGGPNDGANPFSDLTLIGSAFYGTTTAGGASNNGAIFAFTPIPEPSSLLLTAVGGAVTFIVRRLRRKR